MQTHCGVVCQTQIPQFSFRASFRSKTETQICRDSLALNRAVPQAVKGTAQHNDTLQPSLSVAPVQVTLVYRKQQCGHPVPHGHHSEKTVKSERWTLTQKMCPRSCCYGCLQILCK